MADEPQRDEPQQPLEPPKPDEPHKPDVPPRLEERSWFPPPIDPPEKPEPQPGDEPRLPPLRGPEIPNAHFNEQGDYRVPDSDLDLFETAIVEPFLGLGMDEKAIEWLWPAYIPVGKLTLIEGESASGKSFVAADIAARVSRGQPWPGRIQGPQLAGDVIFVSLEDSREDTLAPRLRQAGAQMSRFQFLTAVSTYDALKKKGETVKNRRPGFDQDLVHLEHAIRANENVRLVVIDSLPTLCPDKKTYRQTLRRLEEIARRRNVAIVATARPCTRSRGRPRVEGDKLSEEVRCLFNVLCDPEDRQTQANQRRFLAPVRMNFCEEPEWLAFRIVGGVLVWETPTDGAPLSNCLASPTRQKAVRLHEAIDWLTEALKDEDQPAAVMNRQARALGHSHATVRRACERLRIHHIRCEFGPIGLWLWALPRPGEERTASEEPRGEAMSAPDETPPGPPLRRGGKYKCAPDDPGITLRRGETVRRGKSPKGKNGRGKVPESSLPELPDRFGSNAGWRELLAEVLAGLGGGERRPSTGRPRKPR
jgi:putative DNA primase/helicase